MMQISGGATSSPQIEDYYDPNPLILDHWYDVVIHIFYANTAADGGLMQWWVDGVKLRDVQVPTQYYNGSTVYYNTDFDVEQYHSWETWQSSVDFENLLVGSSEASVGFSG